MQNNGNGASNVMNAAFIYYLDVELIICVGFVIYPFLPDRRALK